MRIKLIKYAIKFVAVHFPYMFNRALAKLYIKRAEFVTKVHNMHWDGYGENRYLELMEKHYAHTDRADWWRDDITHFSRMMDKNKA